MPPPFRFQPRVEPLGGEPGALDLAALAARLPPGPLVFLAEWPGLGSLLAFAPLPARLPRSLSGLRALAARLVPAGGDPVPGAFHGGFLGALAYELGAAAEPGLRLPGDPWGLPPVAGGLFTDFLVRPEGAHETFLVLGEDPGDGRPSVVTRARALRAALAVPARETGCVPDGPLRRLGTPAEHAARIVRAREWIAAGEIYQANLSFRLERDLVGDPFALHRRLVGLHPAPYAGFLRQRGLALLSASPELLLEHGHDAEGARARTRPIKGTAPRHAEPERDRTAARALLASAKDLAELAMIVDLERNDLGRVARPGSVRVEEFPRLARYASVHHLSADVLARPRPGVDAWSVLAALFPGGSVTGAPKLRSMEAIRDLEGEWRGFAYGSLVAADLRGELRASLLIRTLIWRPRAGRRDGGCVTFRVGGGITWGSDPAAEEAEAQAKGVLLARALEPEGAGSEWRPGTADALL